MADGKDKNFLEKLASKRGCTVAAMLAVATATQDGNVPQDKLPEVKTNPVEKTVSVENTSAPVIRTPDAPVPQGTLDLGGPAGFNLSGMTMPSHIDPRPLEVNAPKPDLSERLPLDIEKEFAEDAADSHYDICSYNREEMRDNLQKLSNSRLSQAEEDSILMETYASALEIGTSKTLNLVLSPAMAKLGLQAQKMEDITDRYAEGEGAGAADMKELKLIAKENKKYVSSTRNAIDEIKQEFDFDSMKRMVNGGLDRKAMHKVIDNALKHADSYVKQTDKTQQKEEKKEARVQALYEQMKQGRS